MKKVTRTKQGSIVQMQNMAINLSKHFGESVCIDVDTWKFDHYAEPKIEYAISVIGPRYLFRHIEWEAILDEYERLLTIAELEKKEL